MSRRRLRIHYSSSSEDEDHHQPPPQPPPQQQEPLEIEEVEEDDIEVELQEPTLNLENVTLYPPDPNQNPNPSVSIQFEISDDELIDVSDDVTSPPLPPPPPPPPSVMDHSFQSSSSSGTSRSCPVGASDCSISEFLVRLGLRLRSEWLDSCIRGLESSVLGFGNLDVAAKAKLCFEQFLFCDMNYSGAGILPENVHDMHLVDLAGPLVLQVDEIVNISCPLKGRYQNANSGLKRCLKLSMTDGVQRVFGMEYRPIKDLEVLAPAGLKVAIRNVNIRRGILLLVPEVLEILGGMVEDLEGARQRLVQEVNKPPRGKRTRNGVVPPLATRATHAAWPPNGFSGLEQNISRPLQPAAPLQAAEQGGLPDFSTSERTTNESAIPNSRNNAEPNSASDDVADMDEVHMVDEVEHPFILSGDREIPFTYVASLSAKWAAVKDNTSSVQGKIKCFLTGVKGFQYKQRATFELRVYVDDGSLILEILIDHNLVQKSVGHSPEEVTAALTSSDMMKVSEMKETLKQFQIFLANFEGTMVVRISEASPFPVAIEMNQGCPSSDAWLLLKRLQSSNTSQPQQHGDLEPINLSP